MANLRIKDIATEATTPASDDYIAIDGATNGTRRITASGLGGGGTLYDFDADLTPSVDTRGVKASFFMVYPSNTADLTVENAMKIQGYIQYPSMTIYPLITIFVSLSTTAFTVALKSFQGNPQNTTSTTVSGTLHIVTPFEVSNVTSGM